MSFSATSSVALATTISDDFAVFAEVDAEAEAEVDADVEAEAEEALDAFVEVDADAEADAEAAVDVEAEMDAEVEAEAEAEADVDADAEAEAEADVDADEEADVDADVEEEGEADADADADADAEEEGEGMSLVEADNEPRRFTAYADVSFCPNPYKLQDIPGTKAQFDGCGSEVRGGWVQGILSDLPASITACCNAHDIGYDTCGVSRQTIDSRFRVCLANAVNSLGAIYAPLPATMHAAVRLGGSEPFLEAQKRRCYCKNGNSISRINVDVPMPHAGGAASGAVAGAAIKDNNGIPMVGSAVAPTTPKREGNTAAALRIGRSKSVTNPSAANSSAAKPAATSNAKPASTTKSTPKPASTTSNAKRSL